MEIRNNKKALRRLLLVLALAVCAFLGLRVAMRNCLSLSCVARAGGSGATCGDVASAQTLKRQPLSDSVELIIQNVKVTRQQTSAVVEITLNGTFWNESDQNLYLFAGRALPAGQHASYSLSSDAQYFIDLAYPVRNTIELPHGNDVRVGVMAPGVTAYTPQVYINDPVYADRVGPGAHIRLEQNQHVVTVGLPLAEYYGLKNNEALPERISVTAATARDYVGFIDQLSVMNVAAGETKSEDRKGLAPVDYPTLNYDAHVFRGVKVGQANGSVSVELEMGREVEDWAQTNLYFFFIPYPPPHRSHEVQDPTKTVTLPYGWSFYCAVYSPNRLFCKSSKGSDYRYDIEYAKRPALEKPPGVEFRALGNARYVIELGPENVREMMAGGDAFALVLMAGRDGFGPTSVYGWRGSERCGFLRRIFPGAVALLSAGLGDDGRRCAAVAGGLGG